MSMYIRKFVYNLRKIRNTLSKNLGIQWVKNKVMHVF